MVLTRMELSDLLTDNLAMFECHMESGVISWASHTMEKMFGYVIPGILEGMYVEELMPIDVRDRHSQIHRPFFEYNPSTRLMGEKKVLRGMRKDRSEFPVEIMLLPKAVNGKKVVVGIVFDMTERERRDENQPAAVAHG